MNTTSGLWSCGIYRCVNNGLNKVMIACSHSTKVEAVKINVTFSYKVFISIQTEHTGG